MAMMVAKRILAVVVPRRIWWRVDGWTNAGVAMLVAVRQ
jgi:hypothetical protein